jgi:Uma2 family endonuclease
MATATKIGTASTPPDTTSLLLDIPKLVRGIVLEPALSDAEFEELCERTELYKLERTKEGKIIVNPPTGLDSDSGNSEITHQLRVWWKEHRRGKVFGPNAGFFLPDGSEKSPDGAYATPEQVKGLTSKDRRGFGYFTPAFVIELLSATDRLAEAKRKMVEDWMANGVQLGWLIDPYHRNVWIYAAGKKPRLEAGSTVTGSGPVKDFVLELTEVWREFED